MAGPETDVWYARPSQVVNLGAFIGLGLFFWLVIPIFIIVWKWLVVRCTSYEMTSERLRIRYGVINKYTDELELYRIRDYHVEQPLVLRLFGLSNLLMVTSDRSHPTVNLQAVDSGDELRDLLRHHVEQCRLAKGVRELDVE